MSVNINFSNIGNPFDGVSVNPPYVTKTITPIFNTAFERSETKYTFNGQIIGPTFAAIKSKVDTLFSNFSQGFFNDITVDSNYSECCQLDSINIEAANYVGIVPYTVEITCHDKTNGLGAKVKNVSSEINFQEGEDGILQASHKISVDGIRTTAAPSDALENAKNFVIGITGLLSNFGPFIKNGQIQNNLILISQKETIDPINANISIEESYVSDLYEQAIKPLLRYKINVNNDFAKKLKEDNITINVNGEVRGGRRFNLKDLISRIKDINLQGSLLPYNLDAKDFQILSEDYKYDSDLNIISFSRSYTDDKRIKDGIISSFSVEVDKDFVGSTSRINYQAETRPATVLDTQKSKNSFKQILEGKKIITDLADDILGSTTSKNLNLINKSITSDEINGIFSTSESWDDRLSIDNNLVDINLNIKISPSLDRYNYTPILDEAGGYVIEDLKYKSRSIFSINGSASINVSKVSIKEFKSDEIVAYVNKIRNQYFQQAKDLILTKSNISISKENGTCSFDVEYSSIELQDYT